MRLAPSFVTLVLVAGVGCVASGVIEERVASEPTGLDASGETPAPFEPTPDAGGVCAATCSADLRSVEDCRGNALKVCADDQGCSNEECIDACAAADAAKGTIGCEFFVAPMAFQKYFESQSGETCSAAMLVNPSKLPVSVSATWLGESIDLVPYGRVPVTRGGIVDYQPLPVDGKIPAEGVALFFLRGTADGACPVTPATVGPMLKGTGVGDAFRIQSSLPVTAYSVLPALTSTATLALLHPTASWGTSYVAAISEPSDKERSYMYLENEEVSLTVVAKEPSIIIVTPTQDVVGRVDVA